MVKSCNSALTKQRDITTGFIEFPSFVRAIGRGPKNAMNHTTSQKNQSSFC